MQLLQRWKNIKIYLQHAASCYFVFDSLHYNAVANNDIINSGSRGSVNMSETFFFLKFRFGSIWMQKEHFPFLQMIEKMK